MKHTLKITLGFIICSISISTIAAPKVKTTKAEVRAIIEQVNNYWQTNNGHKTAFWHEAAYHTGNMEAYSVTKDEKYLQFSEEWSEKNNWQGATEKDKSKWKYSYGERPQYVLFGDWQICFQTYIDLYKIDPKPEKIARVKEVMEYQMSTPNRDYWWWVDGLYMVMPVMTKMYQLTKDEKYLEKLAEYYQYSKEIMYDPETHLFYRDAKYIYPKHKTASGKKDFWARGDGWLFAGLAKVLQDLPKKDPRRKEFEQQFKNMAVTLVKTQQSEGYWTRSMLDPEQAPGPETSGTAFFTYGLLWGINNGYLKKSEYLPTALNGWKYLTEIALQSNGRIGYVQPIGEKAIPGQVINAQSTADFGVGAFLLAACEMYRFCKK